MAITTDRRACGNGFTLIEVCVAMVVLAIAMAGLAGLVAMSLKACVDARVQTTAVMLADQKIEQLRGLAWGHDPSGSVVSDLATDVSRDPAGGGGSGLSPSPANSLDANLAGHVDYLDSSGLWVGTGPSPPSAARYIRRWRIAPVAGDPDTLVFDVLVTTVARDRAAPRPRHRLQEDAMVTTMRGRR